MPIFSKKTTNPIERTENDLEQKRAHRADLFARSQAADQALTQKREAIQKLTLDGADDQQLRSAETEVRSAHDRVQTLAGALAELDRQVDASEQELAAARDQNAREHRASEIEQMATRIDNAAAKLGAPLTEFADAMRVNVGIVPEALPIPAFCLSTGAQLQQAGELVSHMLRDRAKDIRNGTAPLIASPRPVSDPPPIPEIPKRRMFALQHVKWREHSAIITVGKYTQIDLPIALVDSAKHHHLVDEIGSDRARRMREAFGPEPALPPDDRRVHDVDALAEQQRDGTSGIEA